VSIRVSAICPLAVDIYNYILSLTEDIFVNRRST
jgi:hypothetical protein